MYWIKNGSHRLGAKDALWFAAVSHNWCVVQLQAPINFDNTADAAPPCCSRMLDELACCVVYHAKVRHTLPSKPYHKFHTVLLKCSCRDQGRGNLKGMLLVVTNYGWIPDDYKHWSNLMEYW
mmetsp:Transcript_48960/g.49715  ORF Transcript_48960/g.49715 Transcript_48960/m.49715 type:complete len:122 (-) Transcript_48960:218-583(-)